jgi:hypothetical protein
MKFFLLTLMFTLPLLASAASFEISMDDLSVGQAGLATLYVLPEGQGAYTAQVSVGFDTETLSVDGVTTSGSAIELSKEGYDEMSDGMFMKTVGFPGGVTEKTAMLTFVVTKHAAGVSTVSVLNTSSVYNKEGENIATGFGGKTFGAPVEVKKVVAVAPVVLPPAFTISEDVKEVEAVAEEEETPLVEVTDTVSLPAAVVLIDGPLPVVPLAILLLVVIMMLWVYLRMKSKRNMLAKHDIK